MIVKDNAILEGIHEHILSRFLFLIWQGAEQRMNSLLIIFQKSKKNDLRNVSMNYFHCTKWLTAHPLKTYSMICLPLFNLLIKINSINNRSYKKKRKKQQPNSWILILKLSLLKSLRRREKIPNCCKKASSIPFSIPKPNSFS